MSRVSVLRIAFDFQVAPTVISETEAVLVEVVFCVVVVIVCIVEITTGPPLRIWLAFSIPIGL